MGIEDQMGREIEKLKQQLIYTAEENNFNFQHPMVQHLSEEIDVLIVRKMQYNNPVLVTV